jgi:hypothetical protein
MTMVGYQASSEKLNLVLYMWMMAKVMYAAMETQATHTGPILISNFIWQSTANGGVETPSNSIDLLRQHQGILFE